MPASGQPWEATSFRLRVDLGQKLYCDGDCRVTRPVHDVQAHRIELDEVRVTAVCHYRAALRSFIASRMVEVTDLATGEVHEDGLSYFLAHPMLKPPTPDSLASLSDEILALQECRDEVIVLTFVGAADGLLDPDEMDEIVRHVFDRYDAPLEEHEVRRRAAAFVPDERAFYRALDRIAAGAGDARALMRSLRKVVDADGEIDAEEIAFVDEISRRLEARL